MNSTNLTTLIDGVIGLAVISGAIVLLALGRIDSTAAVSLIGAGVLAAKGATATALALKVPATKANSG